MKKAFLLSLLSISAFAASCNDKINEPVPAQKEVVINTSHPMKDSLRAIINKYVAQGIPGVQVAVKNKDGWYITGGGYASLEKQTPITANMMAWYFSLTKMYTASLVMKLKERGQINLDAPIKQYLVADVANGIQGSDKVTVRMLLNHSSGIVNLTKLSAFLEWVLTKPLEQPTVDDRLKMVYGKPLDFEPGTNFSYSNTNFLLLTLIIEKVAGKSYGDLLKKEILQPLGLKNTYYDLTIGEMKTLPFSDYYVDLQGTGQLQSAKEWNSAIGNSCVGYGGIAGTAEDAIRFMEAWNKGNVVSSASMQEMRAWIKGKESTQPDYGLGLEYYQYSTGTNQYGHEGDGLGNTTQMLYVPDNDTYLYINCLAGRQLPGPYLYKTTDLKNELCKYVAKWRKPL